MSNGGSNFNECWKSEFSPYPWDGDLSQTILRIVKSEDHGPRYRQKHWDFVNFSGAFLLIKPSLMSLTHRRILSDSGRECLDEGGRGTRTDISNNSVPFWTCRDIVHLSKWCLICSIALISLIVCWHLGIGRIMTVVVMIWLDIVQKE